MSFEITEAFVEQYKSNIFHLSQQKGSRLRAAVRNEMQVGKSAFYERLGSTAAIKKLSRHSDTPQINSDHSRRRVTLEAYEWADLIDDTDKVKLLIDPASPYAQSAMWAMGRAMDDEIIAAMSGNAFEGDSGQTTTPLPNASKLVAHDGSVSTGVNLNLRTLRAAKARFDSFDVDPSLRRYIAITSSQLQSLLGEDEITSHDYNTVKALVQGEIDTFMGFSFIRTERLELETTAIAYDEITGAVPGGGGDTIDGTSDTVRRCLAWAEDGVMLSVGRDMRARISERDDKSYSTQVYAAMDIGATRLEEEKVVQILCNES